MGPPGKLFEDSSAKKLCGKGRPSSRGFRRDHVSNWPRDHPCDILAKNMVAFCLCPKNMPGPKLKSNGPISLV